MKGISAGLAACLAAAMAAGCGAVQAAQPGSAAHPTASSAHPSASPTAARPSHTPAGRASVPATDAGLPGCHNPGPTGHTLVITLADNDKTYCLRVGGKLNVDLRDTGSDVWLRPRVSSMALTPITGASASATGVTSASFAAVQPGQAAVTSIRPPCRLAFVPKLVVEPASVILPAYPVQACPAGEGFSASIIVLQ